MSRVLTALLVFGLACVIGVSTASAFPGPKEGQKKEKKDGVKKPQKTPKEVFEAKDTDKDGKLSKEEFVGKVKKEEARKKLEEMFAKKDKDGDGALTFEEFAPPKKEKKEKKQK